MMRVLLVPLWISFKEEKLRGASNLEGSWDIRSIGFWNETKLAPSGGGGVGDFLETESPYEYERNTP